MQQRVVTSIKIEGCDKKYIVLKRTQKLLKGKINICFKTNFSINSKMLIEFFVSKIFLLTKNLIFCIYLCIYRCICRRRQWQPTPVLLPGKSHGWRSLVGYSPWGREESDTTERLHFHFSLSCIGEGNGNPLQCSCLENPRDGGAWWTAVYGVAQNQTRLK